MPVTGSYGNVYLGLEFESGHRLKEKLNFASKLYTDFVVVPTARSSLPPDVCSLEQDHTRELKVLNSRNNCLEESASNTHTPSLQENASNTHTHSHEHAHTRHPDYKALHAAPTLLPYSNDIDFSGKVWQTSVLSLIPSHLVPNDSTHTERQISVLSEALRQQIDWAIHLGVYSVVCPPPNPGPISSSLSYARVINSLLVGGGGGSLRSNVWMRIPTCLPKKTLVKLAKSAVSVDTLKDEEEKVKASDEAISFARHGDANSLYYEEVEGKFEADSVFKKPSVAKLTAHGSALYNEDGKKAGEVQVSSVKSSETCKTAKTSGKQNKEEEDDKVAISAFSTNDASTATSTTVSDEVHNMSSLDATLTTPSQRSVCNGGENQAENQPQSVALGLAEKASSKGTSCVASVPSASSPSIPPPPSQDSTSIPIEETDGWYAWSAMRRLCNFNPNLGVVLELGELPDDPHSLDRWLAEPLKAVVLPGSSFVSNSLGKPILPSKHLHFLKKLFSHKVFVIISEFEDSKPPSIGSLMELYTQKNVENGGKEAQKLTPSGEGDCDHYEDVIASSVGSVFNNISQFGLNRVAAYKEGAEGEEEEENEGGEEGEDDVEDEDDEDEQLWEEDLLEDEDVYVQLDEKIVFEDGNLKKPLSLFDCNESDDLTGDASVKLDVRKEGELEGNIYSGAHRLDDLLSSDNKADTPSKASTPLKASTPSNRKTPGNRSTLSVPSTLPISPKQTPPNPTPPSSHPTAPAKLLSEAPKSSNKPSPNSHVASVFRSLYAMLKHVVSVYHSVPPLTPTEDYPYAYADHLQLPLEPLKMNLESNIYETFESDSVKYLLYRRALWRCVVERHALSKLDEIHTRFAAVLDTEDRQWLDKKLACREREGVLGYPGNTLVGNYHSVHSPAHTSLKVAAGFLDPLSSGSMKGTVLGGSSPEDDRFLMWRQLCAKNASKINANVDLNESATHTASGSAEGGVAGSEAARDAHTSSSLEVVESAANFVLSPLAVHKSSISSPTQTSTHTHPPQARAHQQNDAPAILVVGAGRGPLIDAALCALEHACLDKGRVFAIEKNPHAAMTLKLRVSSKSSDPGWRNKVKIIEGDVRKQTKASVFSSDSTPISHQRIEGSNEMLFNNGAHTQGREVTSYTQGIPNTQGTPSPHPLTHPTTHTQHQGADVIVSELLGSFSDNELSPECLDGSEHLLNPHTGVYVPYEYSSYLEPIATAKLWDDLHQKPEDCEKSYVVNLFSHLRIAAEPPMRCFTFSHPSIGFREKAADFAKKNIDFAYEDDDGSFYISRNRRSSRMHHTAKCDAFIHGFAGYFSCKLYDDVYISTVPQNHTPELTSWFPIYFPIKEAVYVHRGEKIEYQFWRLDDALRVWYEWCLSEPKESCVHNGGGRYSCIGKL